MFDKERLKAKLANLQKKGGATAYWSPPKDGKAVIRMIPYPHGKDPFLEYYFHFSVGRQSIMCPKKNGTGSECPICDLAADLYNSEDLQDKELSKRLYAKARYYGVVIDRADETKTPKYWGFSPTLYGKFLEWLVDDEGDYQEFMDYKNGLDLTVSLQKTAGKQFPAAEAEPKRRESPLADTDKEIQEIIKSVPAASEVFQQQTVEDIKQKLDAWLNSEGAPAEEPVADEQSEGTVKGNSKEKKPRSSSKSADDIFNEMAEQL